MQLNEELYPHTPSVSDDDNLEGIETLFQEHIINELPRFPVEVWLQFIRGHSPQQLASFSTICLDFRMLAADDLLWRKFLLPSVIITPPQTARSVVISQPELRRFQYLACDKKGQEFQRSLNEKKALLTSKLEFYNSNSNTNLTLEWMDKIPSYQSDPRFAKNLLDKVLLTYEGLQSNPSNFKDLQSAAHPKELIDWILFISAINNRENPSLLNNPVFMEVIGMSILNNGFKTALSLLMAFPDFINEEFQKYFDEKKKTWLKHGIKGAYTFMTALMQLNAKFLLNNPAFMSHLTEALDTHGFEEAFQLIDTLALAVGEYWLSHPTFMESIWRGIKKFGFKDVGFLIRELSTLEAKVLRNNPVFMAQLEIAIEKHGFKWVSRFIAALAKPAAQPLLNNARAMEKLWKIILDHGFEYADLYIDFLTEPGLEDIEMFLSLPQIIKVGFKNYNDFISEKVEYKTALTAAIERYAIHESDIKQLSSNTKLPLKINKAIAQHGFENMTNFMLSLILRSKQLVSDEQSLFLILDKAVREGFAAGIAELNKLYPLPGQLSVGKNHAAFFSRSEQSPLPFDQDHSVDKIEISIDKLKTDVEAIDPTGQRLPAASTSGADAELHASASIERPIHRQRNVII